MSDYYTNLLDKLKKYQSKDDNSEPLSVDDSLSLSDSSLDKSSDINLQNSPSQQNQVPDYEALLEKAKQERDDKEFYANLGKAGAMFGSAYGMASKPADTSVYDQLIKNADVGIQDVERLKQARLNKLNEEDKLRDADIEKQTMDPNSSISQVSRERLKKAFPEVGNIKNFDTLSAAQLEKLGFKMGTLNQGASFQQTRYVDPVTNQVKLGLFNTKTGEIVDTGRTAGFASQFRVDPRTNDIISLNPAAPGKPAQNVKTPSMGTTAIVPGDLAVDLNKPTKLPDSFKIREQLNPSQRKSVEENTKLYLKDSEIDREAVLAARNVRQMLQASKDGRVDGDILRMFQNKFARASGEKGAMTENDVSPFGGRQAVIDRINRAISMSVNGKLPDSDRKFLSDLSQVMEQTSQTSVKSKASPYIASVQRDAGLDEQNASILLGVDAAQMPIKETQQSASGYTPEQRKKRIEELKAKLGK